VFRITVGTEGERKLEWDGSGVGWPISLSWTVAAEGTKMLRASGGRTSECGPSFTLRVLGWLEIAA